MFQKVSVTLFTIVFLFGCKQHPKQETTTTSADFAALLSDYHEEGLKLNPINATVAGDNRYNDLFPNNLSDGHKALVKAHFSKYKEALQVFGEKELSDTEQLSKAILIWECDINLSELNFNKNLMPIDQMWSVNLFMGQLASGASAQPFATVGDYEDWLKRVDGYLDWLASAEAKMREGMEKGFVLPKSLAIKVLPQLESLTVKNLNDHLFYQPIKKLPETLSEEDKKRLTNAYTDMVLNKVVPAYQKLHDFMKDEYMPAGRESSGIQGIPNGDASYRHQIKKYTTTNMTADEIHELGLSEVERDQR